MSKSEEKQPPIIRLCEAEDVEYKAYIRDFPNGAVPFVAATCSYPVGPYEIYFEENPGVANSFKLMEKAPSIFYNLITYHVASKTIGQPPDPTPTAIEVIDGSGTHQIQIEKWSS